jgi:exonuclease SbcC
MIPIRLKMKNFLPYRDPDMLYFEGIHLACLTGNNGAGKSSILDAITWVLWGRARAKTEGELIHLGQSDMFVQLDFEHDGSVYRVLRQRSAGKNGKGALELFIVKADETLQQIKEPNMRDTQKKITAMLKLDYDTFISSAYLQQGKADAFTLKTASERKQVLSDILGIDRWRDYEDRAKERLKTINQTIQQINGSLSEIENELRKEPHIQREHNDAQATYHSAETALNLAQSLLQEVESTPKELTLSNEQFHDASKRLKELESDLQKAHETIQQHQARIADFEAVLQDEASITQGYEALQTAREQDSSLGEQLRLVRELETHKVELERDIQRAQNELEKERTRAQTTLNELQRAIAIDPSASLHATESDLASLKTHETERENLLKVSIELKEERGTLTNRLETLKIQADDIKERIETLNEAQGATCPLCGQALTEEHRVSLSATLNDELEAMRHDWKMSNTRRIEIVTLIKQHESDIDRLGKLLARMPALQAEVGKLQKQQHDVQTAQLRLLQVQGEYDALDKTIENADFAHETRHDWTHVTAQLQAIAYDSSQHAHIQQTLKQFSNYEAQNTRLSIAKSSLPTEQMALDNAHHRAERLQKSIANAQAEQEILVQRIEALKELVLEYQRRLEERNRQQTAFSQASRKLGETKQMLTTIAQQKERKIAQEKKRDEQLVQQSLYEELKIAFGKNGVPAMIIESAIPELELLANDLLTRMTEGRMHLRLTTQTEKSDGGLRETLDIEIADDLGTRAYEMYSGGEAFRINFALRVGLSKLLARRAGAQLQTLFIDEGFGTQDEDGRSKLVEAINAVQDDFRLILVITHMEDLRDSFPVHVVVEKTSSGSMVSVR